MDLSRFYFRCTWCERVVSVDCSSQEVKEVIKAPCPLCNEVALRLMGRVEKSNIVRTAVKSICDERCTNASGPHCSCECNQANHGTKKLITFDKIVGKLSVVNAEMLNNNEVYLARIKRMAEAKNVIKQKVLAILKFKNKDILDFLKTRKYWELSNQDYWKYATYKKHLQQIDKIEDYKSIQRKVNALAHMLPLLGTNLELLQAMYEKKQEVNV